MREDQVRHFIEANLSKIVLGCAGAVYPAPFKSEAVACKEYYLDLPIVGHQLVCTEGAQILSFIVMDLNSFLAMGRKMFPEMPRNESVKMLVSANSEIINTISSNLACILSKAEGKEGSVITPPAVMNYSGDQKMAINCADSIILDCKSSDFGFRFIATFQIILPGADMSPAENNGITQEALQGVTADFEVCARRAIECLLNRPTLLSKAFCLQPQSPAQPLLRCFIESCNDDYRVTVSLGVEKSGLLALIPGEVDESMALDAVGEMVNVLAGSLFGRPSFRSRFGSMRASVPSIMETDTSFGRYLNVGGTLLVGSFKMILELAVNSNDARGQI